MTTKGATANEVLEMLGELAQKYEGDTLKESVLLSFLRGECEHFYEVNTHCELCGTHKHQRG